MWLWRLDGYAADMDSGSVAEGFRKCDSPWATISPRAALVANNGFALPEAINSSWASWRFQALSF